MDCTILLQDHSTLRQLEAVCRKRFGDAVEADECYLFILDKCRENDFHRLRAFLGKSSLKTYLYTLFNNLAADFNRAKFGRRRIPKVVSALGAWAEEVYKLVCWQRYSYEDAWEITSLNQLYTESFNRFLNDIEELGKVPCAESPQFFSTDDGQWQDEHAAPRPHSNPLESLLEKLDRKQRLQAAGAIRRQIGTLTPEDQLLIRLIYGDKHSISAAGRLLGLEPVQAQRRLKKLLTGFKEALLREGITGL